MQDSSAIYRKWIQSIAPDLIDPSIESYNGVNLDDPNQRDNLLFPRLRKNMYVVDFWLSNVVFSKELKIFEKKLMCTAWDLCSQQLNYLVTGFSGTNDTKEILPMLIAQNDLPELKDTNMKMRETLLQPRNESYECLPANVSGRQILKKLVSLGIPVLLDSGALMLELNNEQVAFEWIKLATQYDAAVYFDESDTLQTIDRRKIVTQLDCSVYNGNLDKCVIYLDDAHTRGTDLKFPLNWKACVTLSGDITYDKTVQACMRMRQLQTSQSISFWASHEADLRIRKRCVLPKEAKVRNEHVIKFIEHNSRQFVEDNMKHWTTASINYTKKLIGHKLFEDATDDESMKNLYEKCVDNDLIKLSDMFGEKKEGKLKDVAWAKFSTLIRDCKDESLRRSIRKIQDHVYYEKLTDDMTKFTHALDEEQEKELETEVEEQSQVERPSAAKPVTPTLDERLENLITNGLAGDQLNALKSDGTFLSIPASLSHTQLHQFCANNENAWADHLLVTKDFQMVVHSSSSMCDDFLRPVCWLARIQNIAGEYILILLSSFESNHLLSAFRKSKFSTLFMYRPRLSESHSNLIHDTKLRISGTSSISHIGIADEVQIGMYAGMMYFKDEIEQNAYCGFLGLIPQPRTGKLRDAFEDNIINSDGFVSTKRRRHSEAISNCVGQCKFNDNPVNLAAKFIRAHHQSLPEVSHAASILNRGLKVFDDAMQIE